MIDRAAELLGVKPDEVQSFEERDIFNGHDLTGCICRLPDHRYGALVLFSVNDEPCEQVIYCTPKLHYPFDKNGDYLWPKINRLELWDKLDGTNILAFWYRYGNERRVCFKTRLTPVLRDGGYGSFLSMWQEYTADNEWIDETIFLNPEYNLSFELYGMRNPITVQYDMALEVALLFGVRQSDSAVRPPSQLCLSTDVRIPILYAQDASGKDPIALYERHREEMTGHIEEQGKITTEGIIFYAHTGEPSWRQFKCKPEQVQDIHWAACGSIQRNAIWTTAINAYEDKDAPTVDDVITLLEEEFTVQQIERSRPRIHKLCDKAREHMAFVKIVNEAWAKARADGFDVKEDKAATMRFLSQHFSKGQMRKVGSIVLRQAGLL